MEPINEKSRLPQPVKRRMRMMLSKLAAILWCSLALLLPGTNLAAATVAYDLTIALQKMNFTGQPVEAIAINGQLPGPILYFTEGDHAVIRVHNHLSVATSIHWHGILLPNNMDGVPFLTFAPIAPGTTFTYEFDLRQAGTYWYHSHSGLQEQRGLFGALVIKPKKEDPVDHLREYVVMLSDWTDEDADSVLRTLKRGNEWYSLRKGSGQSILGATRLGMLGDYFAREIQRMPPMDIADVYYERFLINGAAEQSLAVQPGEKIRLRVIAGSASTSFYVQFAGGPLQIIAADGLPVQPFAASRLLIAVAETYDVIITIPADGSYEFRATSQDGSGHSLLWLGSGARHAAPDIPRPDLYSNMDSLSLQRVLALTPAGSMGMAEQDVKAGKLDQPGMHGMNGMEEMDHHKIRQHSDTMAHDAPAPPPSPTDHAGHDMAAPDQQTAVMAPGSTWLGLLAEDVSAQASVAIDGMSPDRPWPPYEQLRALQATAFAAARPVREIRLTLDGDMERLVWFLNNKPLSAADHIEIKQDEVVRFIMINRTMMHHPIHLHGHFSRVINSQGDFSPLKHTVNVPPMTTTVIELAAEEFGDWLFHCHLLYHMESGMEQVVHYQGFTPDAATAAVRPGLYHDPYYLFGQVDVLSQMAQGALVYANRRHIFSADWQAGWQRVDEVHWELTPTYDYYLNRFTRILAGVDLNGISDQLDKKELLPACATCCPSISNRACGWIPQVTSKSALISSRQPLPDWLLLPKSNMTAAKNGKAGRG